jgi:hypothetical protein
LKLKKEYYTISKGKGVIMSVHLWGGRLYTHAEYKSCKKAYIKKDDRPTFKSFCVFIQSLPESSLETFLLHLYNDVCAKTSVKEDFDKFLKEYKNLLKSSSLINGNYKVNRAYIFYCKMGKLKKSKHNKHNKRQIKRKNNKNQPYTEKITKEPVICLSCKHFFKDTNICAITKEKIKNRQKCLFFK